MEFINTKRGRDKLLYKGFSYIVNKERDDMIYWRCEKRGCGGNMKTVKGHPLYIRAHDHPPNPDRNKSLLLINSMKERAKHSCEATSRLIKHELSRMGMAFGMAGLPQRASLERCVRYVRASKSNKKESLNKEAATSIAEQDEAQSSEPYLEHMDSEGIAVVARLQKEVPFSTLDSFFTQKTHCTSVMPHRPQGGAIYFYFNPERREGWRIDGYKWFSCGRRGVPRPAPLFFKRYFQVLMQGKDTPVQSSQLRKYVYHPQSDEEGKQGTIIHYMGKRPEDSALYEPSKQKRRKRATKKTDSGLQDSEVVNGVEDLGASAMEQQSTDKDSGQEGPKTGIMEISEENMRTLVDLSHHYPDYIHTLFLLPEMGVLLAHRATLQELRTALRTGTQQPQRLSYYITEKIGNYYVSALLFKHTHFADAPVMPVAFLIHEHKTHCAQAMFLQFVAKEVPEINDAFLVTSGEEIVTKAVESTLPHVWHLCCWRRLQDHVNKWLVQHGISKNECATCLADLKMLLISDSQRDYKSMLESFSPTWKQSFAEYFMAKVDPVVTAYAGKWVLKSFGVNNCHDGVSTDQCDGFDALLKSFSENKEYAIEEFVLGLYNMQCSYNDELQHSLADLGKFTLLSTCDLLSSSAEAVKLEDIYEPAEILKKVMDHLEGYKDPSVGPSATLSNDERDGEKRQLKYVSSTESVSCENANAKSPAKRTRCDKDQNSIKPCLEAKARALIKLKKPVFDDQTKTFVVDGKRIKLFPKTSCTCGSRKQCLHILALKLYMDMDATSPKRILLTQQNSNFNDISCSNIGVEDINMISQIKKEVSDEFTTSNDNNHSRNQVNDHFLDDISSRQAISSSNATASTQVTPPPKPASTKKTSHFAKITIIRKYPTPASKCIDR